MQERNTIHPKYTWDLTGIYENAEAMDADLAKCGELTAKLVSYRGKLGQSADTLADAMDTMMDAMRALETAHCYAYLHYSLDGGDPAAQVMMGKAQNVAVQLMTAAAYMEPEILEMDEEQLNGYLESPRLATYRHYFKDVVRGKAHTLDAKGEEILSKVAKITGTANDVYTMFTDVEMEIPAIHDENGNEAELTSGNFGMYRESACRSVREEAFRTMFGTYKKYNNTFAALYNGNVKKDNMNADIRGYEGACEAALFGGNVPVAVYDSLIEAVHNALPAMQKYLRLRKKALGLDAIDVYDLYCPMVADVEYPMPYEDGKALVKKALAPLGEEYQALLDRAYDERWIDVYETAGKHSGAYSMGVYGVHPFVLLNYTDTLDDAFTLAHELGHAMHSWYSDTTQDFANHDYRIMVAEVASTVNEVLLTKYLLSTETDPKRKAYILNHFLEGFRTTVFRQTLFAEFERIAHQKEQAGETLNAETLNGIYADLESTYYSEAGMQDEIAVEWSYIPHFYRAFYVYHYATGFCSAVAIASRILETGDASGYLHFLTTGGSDYPLEELKLAGIDLTSPTVVADALAVFDKTIDQLAELI